MTTRRLRTDSKLADFHADTAGLIAAVYLALASTGCSALDYVEHYEATATELRANTIGPFYPAPYNRVFLEEGPLGIACINTDYDIVSIGPVILGVPIPVVPVLVGLFIPGTEFFPEHLLIQLDFFTDTQPQVEFDPADISVRVDGQVFKATGITVGNRTRPGWEKQVPVTDLPPDATVNVRIKHWVSHVIAIRFDVSPDDTKRFDLSLGTLSINGRSIKPPSLTFERKAGLRFVSNVPIFD